LIAKIALGRWAESQDEESRTKGNLDVRNSHWYRVSDAELWAVKTAKSLLRVLHRDSGGLNDCAAYLQKRLSIDGNQANRLIDYLERSEFIAAPDENGDRKFL
jgi:DNA segregation ATPase FtsK/SpoIIIE-like protein